MKFTYALLLTIVLTLNLQKVNAQHEKPNIIYIMVDDLGYEDVGCYGSKYNLTPNIDALAKGGLLLTDYHSNGATCSPTRAALMTGQYQNRFGERFEGPLSATSKDSIDDGLPNEVYTLAEALKDNGYATGMYGI